ncbi:MAG TPA: aconitate hydratase, partial [Actinomycetota bacterium]|nr:aconitate hydratase [Actinomycetota bacterium]
ESFERIHRSNLVGMGVLPLQFEEGQSVDALGLTGRELFAIRGLADGIEPGQRVAVEAVREDGTTVTLGATARIDGPADLEQYVAGGVLPMVARRLVAAR